MKYEALPNLPTLGPKFKGSKDFKAVTDGIKKLDHEALEKCKEVGFIKILGHNIEIVIFFLSFRMTLLSKKSLSNKTSMTMNPLEEIASLFFWIQDKMKN